MFWKFSFARIGIQLMVSMRCMCIEPRILYTLFFYYSLFALVWCNMLRFNKTSMRSLTLILTSCLIFGVVSKFILSGSCSFLLDSILHELKISHCFDQVQLWRWLPATALPFCRMFWCQREHISSCGYLVVHTVVKLNHFACNLDVSSYGDVLMISA